MAGHDTGYNKPGICNNRTHTPHVDKLSFGFIAGIGLAAVLLIASIGACTVGRKGHDAVCELPDAVVLRRHLYGSYAQYLEDVWLGQGVGEVCFEMRDAGKYFIAYGGYAEECTLDRVNIVGNHAYYDAMPIVRNAGWSARLERPINNNGSICGKWALCMSSADGSFEASDWLVFREDGTGVWGQGDYNAINVSEADLVGMGHPFSWHVTPCEGGVLAVLDLGGDAPGEATIAVSV
ncbi:MAG: hypothetical protein IKG21_11340 [Atopobiaceae bacterium]|nr:hypothetical protein [Atopobiaceae bacterium]